jgi:predicted cobalt transporter CbtA
MNTILFIGIILLSGCVAGTIHGLVNLVLVEPHLDAAIGIENQNMFSSGEAHDTPEFWAEYYSYRAWQKGGQVLAGAILGTSLGALFGIVFAYSKNSLPSTSFLKKALLLSLIMWSVVYVIPFAKYPANPPTVGDPDTIVLRQTLYLAFIAISGLGALGFYKIYKSTGKKIPVLIGYAAFISAAFIMMPANPDSITAPQELVNGFRAASFVGASVFWAVLALVLGALWQKLRPDTVQQQKLL